MRKFTKFINFVGVDGGLKLEDLAGMLTSFLNNMSNINGSRKGEIRFSQKFLA